jgi:hypothetical protein
MSKYKEEIDLMDPLELRLIMESILAANSALSQMQETLISFQRDGKMKMSPVAFNNNIAKINKKIKNNNIAIVEIEKGLKKYIHSIFPGVSIYSDIDNLNKELEKEVNEAIKNKDKPEPHVKDKPVVNLGKGLSMNPNKK